MDIKLEELIHYNEWNQYDKIGFVAFIVLCIYMFWLYGGLYTKSMFNFSARKSTSVQRPGISVIIAAKNEELNLKEFLPEILNQEYDNFEVIVVNDGSWDKSQDILDAFELEYPHLKLCRTFADDHKSFFSGKKLALTIGIKAAKYEYLLFTDADCKPNSNLWIAEASEAIVLNDLTLLLGVYEKAKGLLNACIRFETLKIAFNYASFAKRKSAYMSVGRNFSYHKSTFFDVNGFSKHLYVPSGDDDLFVQECVKAKKTVGVLFTNNAKTISKAKTTWKQWFYQKRRHVSTAPFYSKVLLMRLFLVEALQITFYIISPLAILFLNIPFWFTYAIYGLTLIFILLRWFVLLKKIGEKIPIILIPFYSVLIFLFQMFVSISNGFNKPKNWMGR